ncbi:MAG: hypothetical protein CVV07_02190 [Gammaproteobacteria bacterium HGW-Gammaproteobacteria-11]|nr:MAG: hypothetical protein CVV07_02190 [Gammaproteobacteria bacterium HGW-Gammaproteobacteria-11]
MHTEGSKALVVCRSAVARSASRVEFQLQIADKNYQVYFDSPRAELNGSVEAAVCMAALGSMRNSAEIHVLDSVSTTFLANQQRLAEIFSKWFPQFHQPTWMAEQTSPVKKYATGRVGCFFTGGVDSFYSFLKHRAEITDLIYVHGYDVRLEDMEKRLAISAMGAAIEQATGIRFIEIETNAIRIFKDHGKWGLHGHGYGLGTVVRLLAGYLDRIYIPSSFAESELMPWASHPVTDVLFSDESISVVHDGCEQGRAEKIRAIASNPMALQHLRVCWEKLEGAYNCGTCEKCLRTMTTLHGLGVLSTARTFPGALDANAVRRLLLNSPSALTFANENVRFLDDMGLESSEIRHAWQHVINRPGWKRKLIHRWRRLGNQITRQLNKLWSARTKLKSGGG